MAKGKSKENQDAVQFLKAEHRQVKKAFEKYQNLGSRAFASKKKLADEICQDLLLHTQVEEEIFYPAFRQAVKDAKAMADEAKVEHDVAKELINQIQSMESEDELFDAKVKVLSEYINHHVKEEEEEMFPAIRDTGVDVQSLGERMQTRKEELS